MRLDQLCWLSTAAYAIHIVEEFALNWRDWARSLSGVKVEWNFFLLANGLVIVLGVVCSEVAQTWPMIGLALPALMLINATIFHIGAFVWTRGRFSPGLISAVLLFIPLGIFCFLSAERAGVLTPSVGLGAFAIGAALMAAPLLLLKAQSTSHFKQTD